MANSDFVTYAESSGAQGHRLTRTADLVSLLEQCHSAGGVHLIDVPVDYSENNRILDREIEELSAKL